MNNQKPSIESLEFKNLMLNFWDNHDFRNRTFAQVYKDFALSGIRLEKGSLEKCSSIKQLENVIAPIINEQNLKHLLYTVDLKDDVAESSNRLVTSMITRIAFKVFLRTYFTSKYGY